ncbi:MAG: type IV pilus assembly protein PilM [Parcubacteria group bacterium]|nr:type IV pilus assembly protein PilM [Parcubacteria group bacterium]
MNNPFAKLFEKAPTHVLGIDIGSSAIKLVQVTKKGGRAVLETYGALSLGPYMGLEVGRAASLPAEKMVSAMLDLLREAHTTTKSGGLAIPFGASLISFIEMPAVPVKQLETMIPLEARKYIPIPISEVTLDWSIIPKDQFKSGDSMEKEKANTAGGQALEKTDVLVVAIQNNVINVYKDIVDKSGLDMSFFEVEIFSTMRSVLDQEVEPLMIFDMGAASTKLYIVERGGIKVSHTISRGSQDITTTISKSLELSAEKAEVMKRTENLIGARDKSFNDAISFTLDHIFSESNRVLLNFQKKYNKNVSKIVLVGGGVSMKGFAEVARANFQTEVVLGDPFSKLEAPAFLGNVLKDNGPEFAVAVGVALRRLQELSS